MSTNNLSSPASGRFSLSAAALHILAMVLMLMDHLWATLLPAQDWLTCAGRLAFPIFAFMFEASLFAFAFATPPFAFALLYPR